jgi:hypothetical protein
VNLRSATLENRIGALYREYVKLDAYPTTRRRSATKFA